MTTNDDRVNDLFARAAELKPAEREAFLDEHCPESPETRAQVERMLEADARVPQGFLGSNEASLEPSAPRTIGRYRLIREVGRGGMGVVYEAEQDHPRRRVALKLIGSGLVTDQSMRRFEHEAQALGQLDHVGIAQIFEAGSEEIGGQLTPYFAMEFVEGLPLTEHADGLGDRETLELFARVCDAIQHAHQRGVIHRDLKPANIIVRRDVTATGSGSTVTDPVGQPKVLDFGVARFSDSDHGGQTMHTAVGQLVGTLSYMSPEQLDADSAAIDTRSDVYALGVILFRLLAGEMPIDLSGIPLSEVARRVRDGDRVRLGAAHPRFRGDLELICATAMEPDCGLRYQSAGALADDIRRFLASEPIAARPPSTVYQLNRFARRNRLLVASVGAVTLAMLAGIAGTSIGLVSAHRTNAALEVSNEELELITKFQATQLAGIDTSVMGEHLRTELAQEIGSQETDDLARAIANTDYTGLATSSLAASVFEPSLRTIRDQFADRPLLQARLQVSLSDAMRRVGIADAAVEPARQAVTIFTDRIGPNEPETLGSRSVLGRVLHRTGDLEAARRELEAVRTAWANTGSSNAEASLVSRLDLLAVEFDLGEIGEVAEETRALVDDLDAALGNRHAASLRTRTLLSRALREQGNHDEALGIAEESLRMHQEVMGPSAPESLGAANNLATILESLGRHERAAELLEHVVETRRESLGERHPLTILATSNLGNALMNGGRGSAALPLLRRCFELSEQSLGPDHTRTTTALNSYAGALDVQGQYLEAEPLYRDNIDRLTRSNGPDHPNTLRAISNHGYVLTALESYDEAVRQYERALDGMRRTLGDDNPSTMNAIGSLGATLLKAGRPDDARPLYEESLERRTRVLGPDHPLTLNAIYNMGDMLMKIDRLDEAEPYCISALDGYRRLNGPDGIGSLYALGNLAELRIKQARLDEARGLLEETVERRARVFGADHPQTLLARERLKQLVE